MNRDHIAETLRDLATDNLNRDDLTVAIADGFIAQATDDADPIEHPTTYATATPAQQEAIDKIMAGIRDYIQCAHIDPLAINRHEDTFMAA